MMFSESIFPILPFVIKFLKQECVLGPVFYQGFQKRHWLLSTWDLIRWDDSSHHNTSEKSPVWYLFGGLLLDLNRRFSLGFCICDPRVTGSRIFYEDFAGPARVLSKVFQHHRCRSRCTCIPEPLSDHVPSSSAMHSFALAPPSLTDRIYCGCLQLLFLWSLSPKIGMPCPSFLSFFKDFLGWFHTGQHST